MSRSGFERAIVGNSIGAFIGGISGHYAPPESVPWSMAHHSFYGVGATLRHAGQGLFHGVAGMRGLASAAASGPFYAGYDYLKWRSRQSRFMEIQKAHADEISNRYDGTYNVRTKHQTEQVANYGRALNNDPIEELTLKKRLDRFIKGPYKPRRFQSRNFSEHMAQGTRNYAKLLTSPTNWGIHIAFAGLMSNDNLLDPKDGFVKSFAESVLGEAGFMAGAAIAPAMVAAAVPGSFLLAGTAMVAGAFGGALAASAIPGMISDYSDWGNANGRKGRPFRSSLINSEQAATMRQRGLQAIYRSQMSARSALGSEALSYHS